MFRFRYYHVVTIGFFLLAHCLENERDGIQFSQNAKDAANKVAAEETTSCNGRWIFFRGVVAGLLIAVCFRRTFVLRRLAQGVDWIREHVDRHDFIEGLSRSLRFVFNAMSIFLTYQLTPLTGRDSAEKEEHLKALKRKCAELALELIRDMGGYYIKAAQTLCGAGLFPQELNDAFGQLLDECPKQDYSVVKNIIEAELGCRLDVAFVNFEQDAIAAASIGQVHFAQLRDGTRVAVKIQYPNVERFFSMDVRTAGFLVGLSGMGSKVKDVFTKLKENMEQEFDYTKEAKIMNECAGNICPHFGEHVVVPRAIDGDHPAMRRAFVNVGRTISGPSRPRTLCTRKVLTMERLDGVPIRKHTMRLLEAFASQFGTSVEELKDLMTTADPSKLDRINPRLKKFLNMGPITESQSFGIRMAIKFRNGSAWLLRNSIANCQCAPCEELRAAAILKPLPVPLNGPKISKLLFDVHGHEIFQNGLFNSDPHAGNVLMLPDGKVGLIDYGACMRLTEEQRTSIARLLIAIANNDDAAVPSAFYACGFVSKKNDSRLALLLAHLSFNRGPYAEDVNRLAPIVGLPPDPTVMDLESYVRGGRVDEIVSFPGHLVLLQRCCMVLSGIGMEMGAGRLSSAGMFKRSAERWLESQRQSRRI